MSVDDIYHCQFNFENPSNASSTHIYYQQSALGDQGGGPQTEKLADSVLDAMTALIRAAISSDWWFTSVYVRQVYFEVDPPGPEPASLRTANPQVGLRGTPALPANDSFIITLQQTTFSARSDGVMFFPGIPEADTTIGLLDIAYVDGAIADLRDALINELVELSGGSGRWTPGVISTKVLNAAPPFKDWSGAFAAVLGGGTSSIIRSQRGRTTRVKGGVA